MVTTLPYRHRVHSSTALILGGVILMGLGVYFIFLRPPLLREDPRFMGASLEQIRMSLPGLSTWLTRVFWVMGGYMFASGVLTTHVATTSFKARAPYAVLTVVFSGLMSIGLMSAVNFIIDSDFKWLLFTFTLPWVVALLLYVIEGQAIRNQGLVMK